MSVCKLLQRNLQILDVFTPVKSDGLVQIAASLSTAYHLPWLKSSKQKLLQNTVIHNLILTKAILVTKTSLKSDSPACVEAREKYKASARSAGQCRFVRRRSPHWSPRDEL